MSEVALLVWNGVQPFTPPAPRPGTATGSKGPASRAWPGRNLFNSTLTKGQPQARCRRDSRSKEQDRNRPGSDLAQGAGKERSPLQAKRAARAMPSIPVWTLSHSGRWPNSLQGCATQPGKRKAQHRHRARSPRSPWPGSTSDLEAAGSPKATFFP